MKNIFIKRQNAVVYLLILVVVAVTAIVVFTPLKAYRLNTVMQKPTPMEEGAKQSHSQSLLEKLFLPTIKERLKKNGMTGLSEEIVSERVKEVRIWVGFSLNGFRGIAIRQDGTSWSATYYPTFNENSPLSSLPRSLSPPKNGWQKLSQELREIGLYDFTGEPDKVPGKSLPRDSISAVVEIKSASFYRAYGYYGLLYDEANEIKKMEIIVELLSSEFGIQLW